MMSRGVTQFWGAIVKGENAHVENMEEGIFVSVSQAILVKGKADTTTYLFAQPNGGKKVALAAPQTWK